MSAFSSFKFTPPRSSSPATITIGTGQSWGSVDQKLDAASPGAACLSTRCSFVGVGGSLTTGGLSWLSSEYGMASDPGNLLDASIVLANGRSIKSVATEEPDLMWAIRGGGGSFGVVAEVTLRVFPDYAPKSIFTGRILYPRSQLKIVAKAVTEYSERCTDPKMALHFYCMTMETKQAEELMGLKKQQASMGIAIMMYDAHGEEHGRFAEGFKWAMDIEGAMVLTETMGFSKVNALGDDILDAMGEANSYFSGITVPKVDEKLMLNAWKWMDKLLEKDPAIADVPLGTVVLIEVMQKAAFGSLKSPSDAAWPHTKNRHVVQLGAAAPSTCPELEQVVLQALADAPKEIIGEAHEAADFIPNFLNSFNDPKKFYGENYKRLVGLKKRYDPKGLFRGPFMEPIERAFQK